MRKMSLAKAKAHISELVDQAEHHGKRVLILRHGKPAAAIVDIEVVSALVRRGAAPTRVAHFFEKHFSARTLVTIGPRAARAARAVVGLTNLRAADALYVWLAAREGVTLVTSDHEVLSR